MSVTVPQLTETLQRSGLLSPAEVKAVQVGWFHDRRQDANDPAKFGKWLVLNGYLSEFSLRLLQEGQADRLRLNQYLLLEPITRGPQAGSFLASDPLRRKVVIEILAPTHAANPATVQAFQSAAQQAMAVQQANVNRTLDFGQANGVHYLVREHDVGETLAEILARRGKLSPTAAARLFALALAGLTALHEYGVPAGELTADCLLMTAAGKTSAKVAAVKQRTIKVLNAGVPRFLFDSTALLNPQGAKVEPAPTPSFPTPRPPEDLFRLGRLFYESLTGQKPTSPADPVCRLAPDVPELLGELVDQLVAPDPQQRPRSAAHAAKALRVFLASEEEAREVRVEESLAPPVSEQQQAEETPGREEEEPAAEGKRETETGVKGKLLDLWEDIRPKNRDLVFLGSGAVGVFVLLLLLHLISGFTFVNLVCLLTGGALSFFVERLLRWREEQLET